MSVIEHLDKLSKGALAVYDSTSRGLYVFCKNAGKNNIRFEVFKA